MGLGKMLALGGLVALLGAAGAQGQEYDPDADQNIAYETVVGLDGFFEIEVPEGWEVYADSRELFYRPQPVFMLTSPDERSYVQYGLFVPQVFVEPDATHIPGEIVNVQGFAAPVRAYEPAGTFYAEYIEGVTISFDDCKAPPDVVVEPADGPPEDLAAALPGTFDAVSVYYTCQTDRGYTDVVDVYFRQYREDVAGIGSVWLVDAYVAYIAPVDEQPLVYAITDHVVSSLQVSEAWAVNYQLESMNSTLDMALDAFSEATVLSGMLAGIYGSR